MVIPIKNCKYKNSKECRNNKEFRHYIKDAKQELKRVYYDINNKYLKINLL